MTPFIIMALVLAISLLAWELHEATQPQYRKGCGECDAVRRHAEAVQKKLQHDYAHEHGWGCPDKTCDRNRVD